MKYELYVDDNSSYDEDERYEAGEYETIEAAVEAAKKIVDHFLESVFRKRPGLSAEELYIKYEQAGEDPWIHPNFSDFNSWDYAKQRCDEICGTVFPVIMVNPQDVTASSLSNKKIS
ncbi:MAG: hypothetical protein JXQ30_13705 [Spirochaetes bacterium]|nr:hypothetical protein [Spirochaetota bacterium]